MISSAPSSTYVWTWLNRRTQPVVAGVITRQVRRHFFSYGKSYLARADAVPLAPELPLQSGVIEPMHDLAGALRDASPDSWGRRVIAAGLMGQGEDDLNTKAIDELTYLLESGSNRIGALDFQRSPTEYVSRNSPSATLAELMESADKIEAGEKLHPDIDAALRHGTAIGGARPKALVNDGDRELIAKFSTSSEIGRGLRAEFIAMRLARACGLDAADVKLAEIVGRDVLLIERFDREETGEGTVRLGILSALTLLGGNEADMDDLSYADDLAPVIRTSFSKPRAHLHELYGRIVFNVLCGNSDDHARNHAAFWDGTTLSLTPAYDIAPLMIRRDKDAVDHQAMVIVDGDRRSKLALCVKASPSFQLNAEQATAIVTKQVAVIREQLPRLCEQVNLTQVEQDVLGNVMLHPSIFREWPTSA